MQVQVAPGTGDAVVLAIRTTGYGLVQRAFGGARMGSAFAFAYVVVAAFAVALGDRSTGGLALGSADTGRLGASLGEVSWIQNESRRPAVRPRPGKGDRARTVPIVLALYASLLPTFCSFTNNSASRSAQFSA